MCRNIHRLFNFDPPATEDEIAAAARQYVNKVSGTPHPSSRNAARFEQAVSDVAAVTRRLLESLETTAPPKDREAEAARARVRNALRFGRPRA
jgi:hypothetical protein